MGKVHYEDYNHIYEVMRSEEFRYSLAFTKRGLEIFKVRIEDSHIVKRMVLETMAELESHCNF